MNSFRVVAVDVGSVRGSAEGKYAWAAVDTDPRGEPGMTQGGRSPEGTAVAVLQALDAGRPVAVGWEAPGVLPVPRRDEWQKLGRGRVGEGNRPWAAAGGLGALGTGLVQAAWLCRAVADSAGSVACTCDPVRWQADGGLLLWEAFVSGNGKPTPTVNAVTGRVASQHEADAAAAVASFLEMVAGARLRIDESDVTVAPHRPLNLLAAVALAAGLDIRSAELSGPALVVRTKPPVHASS
jgi:hypothetical protein